MAINYTISYTFTAGTTASSSQVNQNFSDNANTWTGLEALTKSFSNLRVDTTPTTSTDVAIKSYVDKLNAYRRPVLQYSSGTVVNMETGLTGTSGQAAILFPDGTYRTDSTSGRINCNLAQVASGTQSGLRTGTVANNTWYAIYATKSTSNTTDIIAIADTVFPIQANYATLNTNFGSSGWVFLGYIAYGDNSAVANAILKFYQAGNFTLFDNTCSGNPTNSSGIRLATTAAATSITFTYAAGSNIATPQIPNTITMGLFISGHGSIANTQAATNSSAAYNYVSYQSVAGISTQYPHRWSPVAVGYKHTSGGAVGLDIFLNGFIDGALGIGANPLL